MIEPANTLTEARGAVLGWREWVCLPDLGIPAIKAKVDTGARTSALHAFRIESYSVNGAEHVRFWLHPLRKNLKTVLVCEAPVVQRRVVRDSGGHVEERYVIESRVGIGGREWNIELTLTSREDMLFRMLLGRSAIAAGGLIIDPSLSYVQGRGRGRIYKKHRQKTEPT